MIRTRVKICGLTRLQDIDSCIENGVDAMGFVFVESSPRCVTIDQAKKLVAHVPPFIQTVGLFMNQSPAEVEQVISQVPLNLLQFHGEETPADCERYPLEYIKAIPMGDEIDASEYASRYKTAKGFLLDSHAVGQSGGSGDAFDWDKFPTNINKPLILAGGLSVDNVSRAVSQLRPFAVDVSSGVEAAKGIKDKAKIAAFIRGVREGDESAS